MKKETLLLAFILSLWLLAGCSQGASDAGPTNLVSTTSAITNAATATNVAAGAVAQTVTVHPLSIILKSGNSAQLDWARLSTVVAYYELEVLGDNGYSNLHTIPGGKFRFFDTALTQNVTYTYWLRAYDLNKVHLHSYNSSVRINVYSSVASDTTL